MIQGIHLVNFGNHANTKLTFGGLTALVGKNGAGKTTILRAIRELARAAAPQSAMTSPDEYLDFGPRSQFTIPRTSLRHNQTRMGLSVSGPGRKDGKEGAWGLVLSNRESTEEADNRDCVIKTQWSWLDSTNQTWIPQAGDEVELSASEQEKRFRELRAQLTSGQVDRQTPVEVPVGQPEPSWRNELIECQYLHGVGINLHRPSYTEQIPPRLSSGGDNLPSVIAFLMTSEPERFQELSVALRELIPSVNRIRVRPATVLKREKKIITVNRKDIPIDEDREYSGHELIFDLNSGQGIPASVVSEGTLLSLALLTIFHTINPPRLVLIDDVEQALHPSAQRQLIKHLRILQSSRPQLQIILTTHSPYVVDEFEPSEVWLLAEDSFGNAKTKQLSSHPELERAKGVLTTGEFWSAEGERWVLNGGQPPSARE